MTTQEFSNTFDTLINSYRDIKGFGKTASVYSMELDEYEKGVLLTQAQDIIVKSYFDRTLNPHGQGFDDSERRQIDFSEIISVNEPIKAYIYNASIGGINFLARENDKKVSIIVNDPAGTESAVYNDDTKTLTLTLNQLSDNPTSTQLRNKITSINSIITSIEGNPNIMAEYFISGSTAISAAIATVIASEHNAKYDSRGILYKMPSNILFMLNEKITNGNKTYVVVPLNFKEYDRLMSKPYAQPLKKQAWRLFQNPGGFDLISEVIPLSGITDPSYKIRYVRRPRPIVLTDLGDLNIDGVSTVSECELNPIIHMDILNKAVELAYARLGATPQQDNNQKE